MKASTCGRIQSACAFMGGSAVPGASQNPAVGGAEMRKKEKSETVPVAFSVCGVCALKCAS